MWLGCLQLQNASRCAGVGEIKSVEFKIEGIAV
jgi:hypothetical protein